MLNVNCKSFFGTNLNALCSSVSFLFPKPYFDKLTCQMSNVDMGMTISKWTTESKQQKVKKPLAGNFKFLILEVVKIGLYTRTIDDVVSVNIEQKD